MKTIKALVLFVVCFLDVSGQDNNVCGKYYDNHPDFNIFSEICLFENGVFTYSIGVGIGAPMTFSGHYKVRNSKLFLKERPNYSRRTKIVQNWCDMRNNVSDVTLYLYDYDLTPLNNEMTCVELQLDDDSSYIYTDFDCNRVQLRKEHLSETLDLGIYGEDIKVKYRANKGNCIHIYIRGDSNLIRHKSYRFPLRNLKLTIENHKIITSNDQIFLKEE